MNILFNASGCGLGNNGGTKTILRSAETLKKLDVNPIIYSNINCYNWHQPTLHITKSTLNIKYDVEIAVSVWDIADVIRSFCEKKVWWCRGWEIWVNGEAWFKRQASDFVKAGGKIIVNATHLKDKFAAIGIESEVCFSGLDLVFWDSYNNDRLGIGSLAHNRPTKNAHIIEMVKANRPNAIIYKTTGRMNNEEMRDLYNKCCYWICPTELEGFHNVGAEAGLCGCLVYCNDNPSNGMGDYANEDTAMIYKDYDELINMLLHPDYDKVKAMQETLFYGIGSRYNNMKKFVELINN